MNESSCEATEPYCEAEVVEQQPKRAAASRSITRIAPVHQGLMRIEDVKDFHALPYGAVELVNKMPPHDRRVLPLGFDKPIHAFSTREMTYSPENHHLWRMNTLPGIGYVLMDTYLFETALRGRVNFTCFGNEKCGLDKIHVQYIDGNVAPGSRPSLQPMCGICNVLVSQSGNHTCSGCHSMWYCCKDHQVIHWPLHKHVCKQLRDSATKAQLIGLPANTHTTPESAAYLLSKHGVATGIEEPSTSLHEEGPVLMDEIKSMHKTAAVGVQANKFGCHRGAAVFDSFADDLLKIITTQASTDDSMIEH